MDIKTVERQGERSVQTVFGEIRRHKLVFVITGFIVFAGIMVGTLALPPIYQGSALLLSQANLSSDEKSSDRKGGWKPPRTLAQIAQSDDVLRAGIQAVGLKRLVGTDEPHVSFFLHLRSLLTKMPPPTIRAIDSWLPKIRSQLDVHGDATSDILTVTYRDPDPTLAVDFTSAVAHAFIDIESSLYSNPGSVTFFKAERQRFLDTYRDASDKFTNFSVRTGLFAPDEQRANLLKEYSDLDVRMLGTREKYISSQATRNSLNAQLKSLDPAAHSPWVNSLVATLSSGSPFPSGSMSGQVGDPPALLIKVYQDAIVSLFKLNGDVAGAQSLAGQQIADSATISDRLRVLVANKNEFDILLQNTAQASADLAAVARREAEEQVAADIAGAKLQAVKLVQEASIGSRPVFPNYTLILVLAVFMSALFGISGANLWAWRRRLRTKQRGQRVFQAQF